MENHLKEKLKKIKMLVMDVDGTLTDGRVFYSKNGEEMKAFSIIDGMGIQIFQDYGYLTAIITSETSQIVTARAMKLKIDNVLLGSKDKKKDLIDLANELNLSLEEVAFMGDDIIDIPALKIAGFSACPADAVKYVRDNVDYICSRSGGNGAVRELIELILEMQGKSINFIDS
jgi:YrbI family 3-deoxy-D-manno-octulosonate 8-phosphate phosphatase